MLKMVYVCSLCQRRCERPAAETFPKKACYGARETLVHSPMPADWSAREHDKDELHRAHGDVLPQTRFFCAPKCRTAWEEAEVSGVDAFRAVVRAAGLEMRGAVDALADVAYDLPPAPPAYERPSVPEDVPF